MKTAIGHAEFLVSLTDVTEHFARLFIKDSGTHRHRQSQVVACLARAIASAARAAVLSTKLAGVAIVNHGVEG